MDAHNRFHTPSTWLLVRAEWLAFLAVAVALALRHVQEIHWGRFAAAFVLIDVVGYLPGAIAFHLGRTAGRPIARIYHHLYNVTHSFLTAGVVAAIWAAVAGGPEWAMLAIPIHLAGDRGLFGNTYKPVALPFEPRRPEALRPEALGERA
jgi:hypothetical protein